MVFKQGNVNGIPYWGFFENQQVAEAIITDFTASSTMIHTHDKNQSEKYVLSFLLGNKLYVIRNGYYAFVMNKQYRWHAQDPKSELQLANDSVLILSPEYLDDLPKYSDATEFCQEIAKQDSIQYCIPLNPFDNIDYVNYHKVSPFELKNTLIKKAQQSTKEFLNVGRGNPNFVNTVARKAFAHLLSFATHAANGTARKAINGDITDDPSIGFAPQINGISQQLDSFTNTLQGRGGKFLAKAVQWMKDNQIAKSNDNLVHQLVIAALGSFYPDPPQVQPFANEIMNKYMDYILLHNHPGGLFDIFMTEGATAGIMYTFKSLKLNGLLNKGDQIAIITPIFTPYLELPELQVYGLEEIYITGDPNNDWKIPLSHLDELKNTGIKALFLVNPTNPSAVSMTAEHVARIGEIVRQDNPNLLIIADSVYAPFVSTYNSFMSQIPENTIEIYSFSKYFGVTGWRMGMIVMHPSNIINTKLLPNLPTDIKSRLNKRYSIVTETGQEQLTFMQRLVLDSRDVAEAHTGGLATPQQTLMSLFAIYDMTHPEYKPSIKKILVQRIKLLYAELGIPPPLGANQTDYYTIVDIQKLAHERYGPKFISKLMRRDCLEYVFRLAIDYATIVLPIAGFHGPCWAIRVSLANAATNDYTKVGKNINSALADMYTAYNHI